MMTLRQFSAKPKEMPAGISWYLADLGEARGKQELFTHQAPQRLKALREHALIESAVSSNRIEGVTVEKSRMSRLLLLLQCYHLGFEVGRYMSLERLIEQNKNRYYETLAQSSKRWHEGKHDPWPYIGYALYILKAAYREFEERVGQVASPRGAKTELVSAAVARQRGPFRVSDLQKECPGVSIDLIRRVLKNLRAARKVKCLGRGQNAQWDKAGE